MVKAKKQIEKMNLKELRAEAKGKVPGFSRMKKEELLAALGFVPTPTTTTSSPQKKAEPTKAKRTRRAPVKETVGAIEKGVPIPVKKSKGKYPIEDLQPGESFLVGCPAKDYKKVLANVRGAARRVEKRTSAKFFADIVEAEKGIRCWNVSVQTSKKAAKSMPAAPPQLAKEPIIELTDEVEDGLAAATASEVNALTQPREVTLTSGPAPVESPTSFKLDI